MKNRDLAALLLECPDHEALVWDQGAGGLIPVSGVNNEHETDNGESATVIEGDASADLESFAAIVDETNNGSDE
jgi:hypothetical protein